MGQVHSQCFSNKNCELRGVSPLDFLLLKELGAVGPQGLIRDQRSPPSGGHQHTPCLPLASSRTSSGGLHSPPSSPPPSPSPPPPTLSPGRGPSCSLCRRRSTPRAGPRPWAPCTCRSPPGLLAARAGGLWVLDDRISSLGQPARVGPLRRGLGVCWKRARPVGGAPAPAGSGLGECVGGLPSGGWAPGLVAAAGEAARTGRNVRPVHMWWGGPPGDPPRHTRGDPGIPARAALQGLRARRRGWEEAFPAAAQLRTRRPDVGAGRSVGPPHSGSRQDGAEAEERQEREPLRAWPGAAGQSVRPAPPCAQAARLEAALRA